MTVRTTAERRLGAQHAAALALAESGTLSEATPRVLRSICQSLDWDHGALWEVDPDSDTLRCVAIWHDPAMAFSEFDAMSRGMSFARGVGLPGRVWDSGEPAWIPDVVGDRNFPRAQVAAECGLHGALGFPIVLGERVLGVMEFFSREIQEPDESLLTLLATVGSQIGQFIERRRVEEELDKFFTMSLDMLCISGTDGYFKRVNPAWEKTLGFTQDDMLARPYIEFIHPDDRDRTKHEARGLAGGRDVVSFENRYLCKDGSYRWLLWKATLDPDGTRIYAMARDVTAQKAAEDELRSYAAALESARLAQEENASRLALLVKELDLSRRRAEEAAQVKSDFLANMSHEIRTPMNAIMGMTDLALGTEMSEEQRSYLTTVKSSSRALLTLVNDILDLSKIEAGKLELDRVELDLRETIEDSIKVLAVRAGEKGLELACRLSPSLPAIALGDPGRLRQVIVNLVGNAVKFTERGEVVVDAEAIETSDDDVTVRISVRDTGIGVPKDKREQIFAPFTQADSSTTRRYGGSGLGLAISTQLVAMMGGTIGLDSTPGRGSTFHFTARFDLPRSTAPAQSVPARRENVAGVSVLVVDDHEINRRILIEMLESWKMRPTAVDGGRAALDALRASVADGRPFDLLISDGQMPEFDGFMLAEAVKRDAELARVPMILLTSAGRPGDGARCRRIGIAGYLSKPVKQSDLLDAMSTVLGGATIADEAAPPRRPGLAATERPLSILLAEDNAVNQEVAKRILEKRGHAVRVAGNGREAISALDGGSGRDFDVVLMDVQMPEMDGLAATIAIREAEKRTGRHVPIVAMTAHAMEGDRERCLSAGMDGYVTKPVQADRLVAAVESAVSGFDAGAAAARFGGDHTLVRELVDLFLAECPGLVAAIRDAIDASNPTALRHAAHALKGSVANFAAPAPVEAARRLERMGIDGDLSDAPAALRALEAALARFRREASREVPP